MTLNIQLHAQGKKHRESSRGLIIELDCLIATYPWKYSNFCTLPRPPLPFCDISYVPNTAWGRRFWWSQLQNGMGRMALKVKSEFIHQSLSLALCAFCGGLLEHFFWRVQLGITLCIRIVMTWSITCSFTNIMTMVVVFGNGHAITVNHKLSSFILHSIGSHLV